MQQPPWRVMAQEALKARDPGRYQALRRAGQLNAYLDGLASRLCTSYDRLVREIEEGRGKAEAFALQATEEILVHEVLVPETSSR